MSILANSRNASNNSSFSNIDNLADNSDYIYIKNKKALKVLLTSSNLLSFYHNGIKKYYADGAAFIINGARQKFVSAYGVGHNQNKYLAFITDANGDPLIYFEEFEFENDACEALFVKIKEIKD